MSCPPAPYAALPHASALASAPVAALLALFADELPWLSDRYGLVQTATRKAAGKTERIPQLYRQDGTRYHFDALPADSMSAMCFFERAGLSAIEWDEGAMQLAGSWQHPLNLVVWCNLPRIDERPHDFSEDLAQDVLRVLVGAGVAVSGVDFRAERVFERYTLEDKKLLAWPYAGFRIPLVLTERYAPCAAPFAPVNGPAVCPEPVTP